MSKSKISLAVIGPGILVAATGVGAGDLGTATFAGANLGTAVLWAVLVGAGLKFVLNEGLTRWQLATGSTILEGAMRNLASPLRWFFLAYLHVWSYLVAMALMSACGVAVHAIFPIFSPDQGKIIFGITQSVIAIILVRWGGYQLFEKLMSFCVGLMFIVVVSTAILLRPDVKSGLTGLFVPTIPQIDSGGLGWTIALLGGVGGTVTILCYGYWIREKDRLTLDDLPASRLDLGVGYAITAVFGLAMVVIGSRIAGELDSKGAGLVIEVANTLEDQLGSAGPVAKWAFLAGAWGAFFSSLLGVWQSVPYIFADFWRLSEDGKEKDITTKIDTNGTVYKFHLYALGVIPISGLFIFDFQAAMKVNGIVGAMFIPMLATTLIYLNGQSRWVGKNQNSWFTQVVLYLTLGFFLYAGGLQIAKFF